MKKFIADSMLGKLARWLKILGLDVEYFKHRDVDRMLDLARREGRIILTRDQKISSDDVSIFFIQSEHLKEQIRQFFKKFRIPPDDKALSRCILCNTELRPVKPEQIKEKVPPYVFETHRDFAVCPDCERVYWAGSHYKRMKQRLNNLLSSEVENT